MATVYHNEQTDALYPALHTAENFPHSSVVGYKSAGGGQKVAIFRQTAAQFQQRRLQVHKISILPLNCPKTGHFQPYIWYFWKKIFPTG